MKFHRVVCLAVTVVLLAGCGSQQAAAPVTVTTSLPTTIVSRSTVTVVSTVTYDPSAAASSSSAASASSVAAAGGAEFQAQLAAAGLTSPSYNDAVESCASMDAGKDPLRVGGYQLDLYTTLILSSEAEWKGLGVTIATLCPQHQTAYDAAVQRRADNRATAERQSQITYSVTSSGSDSALITYAEDSNFNLAQENGAALPWSKDVTIPEGSLRILSLSAQNSGGGDISCSIAVGGQVVDTATSSGDYAIVTCSHNG